MRIAEAAHQCEPHSHAAMTARAAVVLLVEAIEETRDRVGADPDAVVHNLDAALTSALDRRSADPDVAARRREFHGVVDEGAKYLTEPERVCGDRG